MEYKDLNIKSSLMIILLATFSLAIINSCKTMETELKPNSPFSDIKVGDFWSYEVDSILWFNNESELITSFILDSLVSIENNEGDSLAIIRRYWRPDITQDWINLELYSIRIDLEGRVVRNYDNEQWMILKTPLFDGSSWDGFAFSSRPNQLFQCTAKSGTEGNGYLISHYDINGIDSLYFSEEVYILNQGLNNLNKKQFKYCTVGDCLGNSFIDNGFETTFELIDSNK